MKTKTLVAAIGLILLVAQILCAAQKEFGGGGIVYGDEHSFLIEAPTGWVLDNRTGVSQGLHAVFYPKGSSWSKAPAVMYATTVNKKKEAVTTPQQLIAIDLAKFKKTNPKIVMTEGRPLKTEDGKTALVRLFKGDQWGNIEGVAYIDEKAVVAILVLSSRNQAAFQEALPAFEKLVASYRFFTDDVRMPKKPQGGRDSAPEPKPQKPGI